MLKYAGFLHVNAQVIFQILIIARNKDSQIVHEMDIY